MTRLARLANVLFVLFCLLTYVTGSQTSMRIVSSGTIGFSVRTILRSFTGSHHFGHMDAEVIAELFDMSQQWWWDAETIRQVHRVRPDFKALLYRNIRAIYQTKPDEWQMALENNWLLKDENGQYVYSTIYPQNYLVDIGNTSYQVWIAKWIEEQIEQCAFDGVFADWSLNILAPEYFWATSALPINPRTEAPWTNEEVRQALIQVHKEIKKSIYSKLLVCNGVFKGSKFWQSYDEYIEVFSNSPLDGIMSEGMWYQYKGVWMTEEDWLKSLDFLTFLQDNFLKVKPGRVFVATCKLESFAGEAYPLPPNCTKEKMATYAFASTLLGIKTSQTYLCLNADMKFTSLVVQPMYNVVVGAPVNDYYMVDGTHIYARDFCNVKVLVNPTSNSYMIDLQGTFDTLSGETVTRITMEAHNGMILIKGESS